LGRTTHTIKQVQIHNPSQSPKKLAFKVTLKCVKKFKLKNVIYFKSIICCMLMN